MVDSAELKVRDVHSLRYMRGNSLQNIYIHSVTLNGEPLKERYITYEQIASGGTLRYRWGISIQLVTNDIERLFYWVSLYTFI